MALRNMTMAQMARIDSCERQVIIYIDRVGSGSVWAIRELVPPELFKTVMSDLVQRALALETKNNLGEKCWFLTKTGKEKAQDLKG